MARAFQIHPADNVATLLEDAAAGPVEVLGSPGSGGRIEALEGIRTGHKIALIDIAEKAAVVKFGVAIGHAARAIRTGEWIHLHNLKSNFDERSSTLDNLTGAPTDTAYR
jgi:hypothetical protein